MQPTHSVNNFGGHCVTVMSAPLNDVLLIMTFYCMWGVVCCLQHGAVLSKRAFVVEVDDSPQDSEAVTPARSLSSVDAAAEHPGAGVDGRLAGGYEVPVDSSEANSHYGTPLTQATRDTSDDGGYSVSLTRASVDYADYAEVASQARESDYAEVQADDYVVQSNTVGNAPTSTATRGDTPGSDTASEDTGGNADGVSDARTSSQLALDANSAIDQQHGVKVHARAPKAGKR